MASKVYFARLKAGSDGSAIARVQQLFDAAQFDHLVTADAPTAIKLHFGEEGNDSYVRPAFVRQVVDKIKACGGKPFITDANTLYTGSRQNAIDHMNTAIEHGSITRSWAPHWLSLTGLPANGTRTDRSEKSIFQALRLQAASCQPRA